MTKKTKRPVGRPPRLATASSARVVCRVTEDEARMIQALADREGVSVSELIRIRLLRAA